MSALLCRAGFLATSLRLAPRHLATILKLSPISRRLSPTVLTANTTCLSSHTTCLSSLCRTSALGDPGRDRRPAVRAVQRQGVHTTAGLLGAAAEVVARLPGSLQPYMKLARLDRPIGTWLLFWPCGWSICLAASPGQLPSLPLLATFAAGSFVMRGAGCTINDMWDKNIDNKVERTRDRPITSGQVSMFDALVFLGGQLGVGLLVLLQLNWYSVLLGAASMGLVVTYPVMKRFTYYPQFVLGLAFNWGALLGWSAVCGTCTWSVVIPLYMAGISWTMIYDTIYAHQDKYDDVIIGVKSTAIKFGDQTDVCLTCFASTMLSSLAYCGWASGQTWPFYLSLLGVGGHLGNQIWTLDVNNREDCAKKFISNRWVGLGVFMGIVAGGLVKEKEELQLDSLQESLSLERVLPGLEGS